MDVCRLNLSSFIAKSGGSRRSPRKSSLKLAGFDSTLHGWFYVTADKIYKPKHLREFEQSELGKKYKLIGPSWRRHWEEVIPFFEYPPEVRKMIYTTNAIESLHMQVRKVIKSRGHFPNDEAATKLIYLALRNIVKGWKVPALHWHQAMNQFAIMFGERFFAAGLAPQQKQHKP